MSLNLASMSSQFLAQHIYALEKKALLLVITSHVTFNIQSECFISQLRYDKICFGILQFYAKLKNKPTLDQNTGQLTPEPTWLLPNSDFLIKIWSIPGLFFFIFVFSIQLTVNVQYKFLLMTGFEPRTSGIGSDRSTN